MKKLNPIARLALLLVLLIVAYSLFAIGACLLPDEPVKRHVVQTLERGDLQADYPRAIMPRSECQLDNYTDALILNQAYLCSRDSLLRSAFGNSHSTIGNASTEVLANLVAGHAEATDRYARYWHGSTFVARCLLLALDYTAIRYLLYFVSSLLFVAAAVVVWRRAGWLPVVAAAAALLAVRVFVAQFSLQLLPVVAIAVVAATALALPRTRGHEQAVMLVAGSLTAFFDLLTAPVLTLGLPLCAAIWFMPNDTGLRRGLRHVAGLTAVWAVAYVATWAAKWLIASLVLPDNVFADAFNTIGYRTSDIESWSRLDAIAVNLKVLPWSYLLLILAAFVVVALVRFSPRRWVKSLLFVVVALLPYAWYLMAANHSYLHSWFTYRAQAVSVCALLLAVGALRTEN